MFSFYHELVLPQSIFSFNILSDTIANDKSILILEFRSYLGLKYHNSWFNHEFFGLLLAYLPTIDVFIFNSLFLYCVEA